MNELGLKAWLRQMDWAHWWVGPWVYPASIPLSIFNCILMHLKWIYEYTDVQFLRLG